MIDLLVYTGMGLLFYITYCIAKKEPIIRTKKNLEKSRNKKQARIEDATKQHHADLLDELEPVPFDQLFPNLLDIKDGVIICEDDWYSKIVEITPVNYYLKDLDEQNQIDQIVETWTAKLDGLFVRTYYQNRFIDLTENTDLIKSTFKQQSDLPPQAVEYGNYMFDDLQEFQSERPRYELKIYLIFDHKLKKHEVRIDDGDDIQIAMFNKANAELDRSIEKSESLKKSGVQITKLDTTGITELHYHLFQRRRARKLRFNDIQNNEMLAMYVTASQTPEHMAAVKEEIDNGSNFKEEEAI
ncbi:hypothetical protein LAV72_18535 [Lysinibacillus xylanilyticus]|uniref:hypothetical protein n=1 Tax=Lysinibacillus xylanilyticus TaxID=582475 RepID=UPI002B2540E4|nr:hypothetical protein [Lysinibacillus xylanilyticus]MEB2301604.1 hypothetical protein [Lysinibacillus xylanilyticus]